MEKWDLYTVDGIKTDRTLYRGEDVPKGYYHLVVHIWITNGSEFLISRRSADRPTFPLMYECPGGSVIAGESSLQGALREVEEEIGVRLDPSAGRMLKRVVRDEREGKVFRDILDVYLFRYDGQPSLELATTKEVESVSWMTADQIKKLSDEGKLVNTLEYFFDDVACAN